MNKLKHTIAITVLMGLLTLTGACSEEGVSTSLTDTQEPVEAIQEVVEPELAEVVQTKSITDEDMIAIQYNDDKIEVMEYMVINLSRAIEIFDMVDANLELLGTLELVLKLDDIVVLLENNLNQLEALTPPTDYLQSHAMTITSLQEYIYGVASYRDAIMYRDDTLIAKAYEHLTSGNELTNKSVLLLPKIQSTE